MSEKMNAPSPTVQDSGKFSEQYAAHFVPAPHAAGGAVAPTAMPFKIFSLTNNNVSLVYSNNTNIR